jgi:hypothetical protein
MARPSRLVLWCRKFLSIFLLYLFAARLLGWSFHIPPPGYSVTALAVAAAVMTVFDRMKGWEQVAWLFLLFAFYRVELWSINDEQVKNEQLRSSASYWESKNFSDIAGRIEKSIQKLGVLERNQQDTQYLVVSTSTDAVFKRNQKIRDDIESLWIRTIVFNHDYETEVGDEAGNYKMKMGYPMPADKKALLTEEFEKDQKQSNEKYDKRFESDLKRALTKTLVDLLNARGEQVDPQHLEKYFASSRAKDASSCIEILKGLMKGLNP